ncbi:hypothetical protein HNQ02_001041 [Flavobacterium sp. 7E]|uniref:hypothetical protein n=1 Tax=unclassified Flavobacterium TaxID=196869 RepID=UPI00156D9716|nr:MULTISPECIES: hypothetical protein [unclassified Flavobacterium]MBE0391328.1 hypothetical protein [Flavobacterium sp. PL002]NRS88127.1 hypothetical protein [Flavobacterium sp. 7E]NRT15708.1 hypothetical protein [Flavobacterium sp. 28A]
MKELIYEHETIDDIQMKFMDRDIEFWKEEVSIIRIEILFFKRILTSSVFKIFNCDRQKKVDLLKDLNNVNDINETYYANLTSFINKLEMIKECEDVQCETFYLNNHTKFRADIESHFSAYRYYKINVILFFDSCLEEKM